MAKQQQSNRRRLTKEEIKLKHEKKKSGRRRRIASGGKPVGRDKREPGVSGHNLMTLLHMRRGGSFHEGQNPDIKIPPP